MGEHVSPEYAREFLGRLVQDLPPGNLREFMREFLKNPECPSWWGLLMEWPDRLWWVAGLMTACHGFTNAFAKRTLTMLESVKKEGAENAGK